MSQPGKRYRVLEEFLVIFMIDHVVLLFSVPIKEKLGVGFLY